MNPDLTELDGEALALVLDTPGAVTLAPEQAIVLRSVLEQFAADQVTLLTLQRRLECHEQSNDRIDRVISAGRNLIASRLERPAVDRGFDYVASRRIRAELAEEIARAGRPQEIWAAAARTAIRLVALL